MRYLLFSVLVIFSIGVFAVPGAFADATVTNAPGSATPGCEETNTCFIPSTVTISVGETVTWENTDNAAHTATSGTTEDGPDGVWDSSLMMVGGSFSVTLDEAGTYPYHCMVHPWMQGTVIVVGEPSSEPIELAFNGIEELNIDSEHENYYQVTRTALNATGYSLSWTVHHSDSSSGSYLESVTCNDSAGHMTNPPPIAVFTMSMTFPPGITIVTCNGLNQYGHEGSKSFIVTVLPPESEAESEAETEAETEAFTMTMTNPRVVDGFGTSIATDEISVGQQVHIEASVTNNQSIGQEFTYVLTVRDVNNNTPIHLTWISGYNEPGQTMDPAMAWTPEVNGQYIATIYLYQSIDNKISLSDPVMVGMSTSMSLPPLPASVDPIIFGTNKASYYYGHTITITGFIPDYDENDPMKNMDVMIIIKRPNGNIAVISQITPDGIGQFTSYLDADGMINDPGTYTVEVKWGAQAYQSTFELENSAEPQPGPQPEPQSEPVAEVEEVDEEPEPEPEQPEPEGLTWAVINAPGSATPGCEETNSCFVPYAPTIFTSGTVTWVNTDNAAHTATSGTPTSGPDGVWDSSLMMVGGSFSNSFYSAGTYPYFCMVHPWMQGFVIVEGESQSEVETTEVVETEPEVIVPSDGMSVGAEIQIETDIVNQKDDSQIFAYIVQIKYEDGTPVSISTVTGSLAQGQALTQTISWTPDEPGTYVAEIFLWDDLDSANPLSSVEVQYFTVT